MVSRARRLLRTLVGWFVSVGTDPQLELTRSLREVEERIPEFNRAIGQARAVEDLLSRKMSTTKDQEERAAVKLREALKAGHHDLARSYAAITESLSRHRRTLEDVRQVSSRAALSMLSTKESFLADRQQAMKECLAFLDGLARQTWQNKMTETIESFGTAGIDAPRDEALRTVVEDESFDPSWVALPAAEDTLSPPSWDDERKAFEQSPLLLHVANSISNRP